MATSLFIPFVMPIILRAGKYGKYFRLGLFTKEYEMYVRNSNVSTLKISLSSPKLITIETITTYKNHGSIVSAKDVSSWIIQNSYQDKLLLFNLNIVNEGREHIYYFVGAEDEISNSFTEAHKRVKNEF